MALIDDMKKRYDPLIDDMMQRYLGTTSTEYRDRYIDNARQIGQLQYDHEQRRKQKEEEEENELDPFQQDIFDQAEGLEEDRANRQNERGGFLGSIMDGISNLVPEREENENVRRSGAGMMGGNAVDVGEEAKRKAAQRELEELAGSDRRQLTQDYTSILDVQPNMARNREASRDRFNQQQDQDFEQGVDTGLENVLGVQQAREDRHRTDRPEGMEPDPQERITMQDQRQGIHDNTKQVIRPMGRAVNTGLYDAPEMLARKTGMDDTAAYDYFFGEEEGAAHQIGDFIGDLAGYAVPGALSYKAARTIPGVRATRAGQPISQASMAGLGREGAAAGVIFSGGQSAVREAIQPDDWDMADHALNAAFNTVLGGGLDMGIGGIARVIAKRKRGETLTPEEQQIITENPPAVIDAMENPETYIQNIKRKIRNDETLTNDEWRLVDEANRIAQEEQGVDVNVVDFIKQQDRTHAVANQANRQMRQQGDEFADVRTQEEAANIRQAELDDPIPAEPADVMVDSYHRNFWDGGDPQITQAQNAYNEVVDATGYVPKGRAALENQPNPRPQEEIVADIQQNAANYNKSVEDLETDVFQRAYMDYTAKHDPEGQSMIGDDIAEGRLTIRDQEELIRDPEAVGRRVTEQELKGYEEPGNAMWEEVVKPAKNMWKTIRSYGRIKKPETWSKEEFERIPASLRAGQGKKGRDIEEHMRELEAETGMYDGSPYEYVDMLRRTFKEQKKSKADVMEEAAPEVSHLRGTANAQRSQEYTQFRNELLEKRVGEGMDDAGQESLNPIQRQMNELMEELDARSHINSRNVAQTSNELTADTLGEAMPTQPARSEEDIVDSLGDFRAEAQADGEYLFRQSQEFDRLMESAPEILNRPQVRNVKDTDESTLRKAYKRFKGKLEPTTEARIVQMLESDSAHYRQGTEAHQKVQRDELMRNTDEDGAYSARELREQEKINVVDPDELDRVTMSSHDGFVKRFVNSSQALRKLDAVLNNIKVRQLETGVDAQQSIYKQRDIAFKVSGKVQNNIRDKYSPMFRKAMKDGRKAGKQYKFNTKDFSELSQAIHYRDLKAMNHFEGHVNKLQKQVDNLNQKQPKGYQKKVERLQQKMDQLNEFDYKIPKGWDDARINETIEKFKDNPYINKLQKDYVKYNQEHVWKPAYEGGLISKEVYDLGLKAHPNYIPMRRNMVDNEESLNIFTRRFRKKFGSQQGRNQNVSVRNTRTASGSEREVRDLIQQTVENEASVAFRAENNRLAKLVVDSSMGDNSNVQIFRRVEKTNDVAQEEGVINFYRDGELETYAGDQEVIEAISMFTEGGLSDNSLFAGIANFSQATRRLRTELNPWFHIKSFKRDSQQALNNSQFNVTYRDLAYGLAQSYMPRPARQALAKRIDGFKYFDIYDDAGMANAGIYGFDRKLDPEKIATSINGGDVPQRLFNQMLRPIRGSARRSEAAPRIAVMRAAERQGASLDEQLWNAADVTNYARAGTDIREMNKYVAFMNPSIQGLARNIRMMRDGTLGPKEATRLAARLSLYAVAPAVTATAAMHQFASDDQKRQFNQLNDWEKDLMMHIPHRDGKRLITIPQPYGIGAFQNIAKGITDDYLSGREIDTVGHAATSASSGLAINAPPVAMSIIDPYIKMAMGVDPFTGQDLVPNHMDNLEKSDQYDADTLSFVREFVQFTNTMRDGEGLSPKHVDEVIQGLGGDMYEEVLGLLDAAMEYTGMLETKGSNQNGYQVGKSLFSDFTRDLDTSSGTMSGIYDLHQELSSEVASDRHNIRGDFYDGQPMADGDELDSALRKGSDAFPHSNFDALDMLQEPMDKNSDRAAYERRIKEDSTLTPQEKQEMINQLYKTERKQLEPYEDVLDILRESTGRR